MDVIAERRLEAVSPDIGQATIHLRIGRPVPDAEGDWVCWVQADGLCLLHGPTKIVGVDSWQALILALRFLQEMLLAEAERGVMFYWEDGECAITIADLFSARKIE